MTNEHEFRLEKFSGFDREAAYDEERVYARRLRARQLLGVGLAFVLKGVITYAVYALAGWWGVAVVFAIALVVVFMRGTHAYPSVER